MVSLCLERFPAKPSVRGQVFCGCICVCLCLRGSLRPFVGRVWRSPPVLFGVQAFFADLPPLRGTGAAKPARVFAGLSV